MSAANVLSLARSRIFSNFEFPMKFSMTSSSGKMTIAPGKLPLYLDRQQTKAFDADGIFSEAIKQQIKDSFNVFANPEIFEDGKPRVSVGASYNSAKKAITFTCFVFVKSGKGIKIVHQYLTCNNKEYANDWIFFANFDEGEKMLSLVKDGIDEENISNVLGSGISLLLQSTTIPELSEVLNPVHEL